MIFHLYRGLNGVMPRDFNCRKHVYSQSTHSCSAASSWLSDTWIQTLLSSTSRFTMNQVSLSLFNPPSPPWESWPHLITLSQHLDPEDDGGDRGDQGQDSHLSPFPCPTYSHLVLLPPFKIKNQEEERKSVLRKDCCCILCYDVCSICVEIKSRGKA